LDHIPPILGCAHFEAVASNYAWGRTDKRHIKKLADFRAQGDDALHRQISETPDLLDFDDMPASICVDRLLQECAVRLLCRFVALHRRRPSGRWQYDSARINCRLTDQDDGHRLDASHILHEVHTTAKPARSSDRTSPTKTLAISPVMTTLPL
jgi:hypothetical protein